jgi:membrane associated rhomboid family serine protease
MIAIYVVLLWQIARSQLLLFRTASQSRDLRALELVYLSRCVLVLLIWWVTEDFDAPAHGAALGGLAIGLFWGLLERRQTIARSPWCGGADPRSRAPSPDDGHVAC